MLGAVASCVVDVCVCTFRRPQLAQTLHSLSRLTLAPDVSIRVIIADNDEEPSAIETVETAARETGLRITYLHAPARNISVARNACLDAATAPLVAFIDDDECAAPQWLSALLASMIGGDYAAVLGPVQAIYSPDCPSWIRNGDFHSTRPVWVEGKIVTGYTCNVLFSRTHPAFQSLRFRLDLGQTGGEDTAFFAVAVRAGARLGFAAGAIVTEQVTAARARFRWLISRKFRSGQTHGRLLLEAHGSGLKVRIKHSLLAAAKAIFCFAACVPKVYRPDRLAFWALRGAMHVGTLSCLLGKREIALYGQGETP
ncbi:MAG TPA: glycosyl transferase family A [Rhodospirillaceae bacterium]|nr:glycosyl transferase family A [Rhodospirillaceae bacterium]